MSSQKRLRVGILFGGRSGEHEVSLASAASVIRALDPEKYEAVPIGITKDGRWLVGTGAQKMLSEVLKSGERVSTASRSHGRRSRAARFTAQGIPASRWMLYFPFCMARSVKTARCRACSNSLACPTLAQACSRRPWAWIRTFKSAYSSKRGCRSCRSSPSLDREWERNRAGDPQASSRKFCVSRFS